MCQVTSSTTASAASPSNDSNELEQNPSTSGASENVIEGPSFSKVGWYIVWLLFDMGTITLLTLPYLPWTQQTADGHPSNATIPKYSFAGATWDLTILAGLRVILNLYAILREYFRYNAQSESPFELYHRNGDKKTKEELEQEALEEAWGPWWNRWIRRPCFAAEVLCVITSIFAISKCLARLTVELGAFHGQVAIHPLCWLALLATSIFCAVELMKLEAVSLRAGEYGRWKRQQRPPMSRSRSNGFLRRIGSNLSVPLLSGIPEEDPETEDVENAEASHTPDNITEQEDGADVRGVSDITGDTSYKAKWQDLLTMIAPDAHLVALAFVFLVLAAGAQVLIPIYTGDILTDLAKAFSGNNEMFGNNDDPSDIPIWEVPGFVEHVIKLVVASILCGAFSGLRGSIFTMVGGRVNVRLRLKLMDSLLAQDIGFFDVTKTGDITSRLSSDTTLVGDQVTLNFNVFLRSLIQVIGVLLFMFMLSWQLSLLAFISVPVITALSKIYGEYVRRLTKLMQKKLADGNATCEAALSSMPTVRALDGATAQLSEFEENMNQYLNLNVRSAIAYFGYSATVSSLPNLVTAVVLFYGGLLVRNGDLDVGDLVKFLLFLQSLSDAFSSIGYIFSSLTQAVGAADKVFELMHREPKIKTPSSAPTTPTFTNTTTNIGAMGTYKTTQQRLAGMKPERCEGAIELKDVELYYPARPNRKVLDGLSLSIPKGSVVALVGPSGSGKSSVMSLIQHLYEAEKGKIMIDGTEVHELSPLWLSQQVAVVSQEPTLFARSVARNIMYGMEGTTNEPSQEDIERAARLANAHDFIEKLPFGYDTDVGERGVQLSGGQKQRIAIARALVRRPKILLLDEATSALDAESEALVQEAIDGMLSRGRNEEGSTEENSNQMTVLIVAHRLSTVRNADTIFVIEDGKVVEEGNHDQLLANPSGAYANLVQRQMKAQEKLEQPKVS